MIGFWLWMGGLWSSEFLATCVYFILADDIRNDSPRILIEKKGVFWGMVRNTGEYEELVQLVK